MNHKEEFTFFWSGPFSQWHPCVFSIGGNEYNCAEQYMMAEKARMFGDDRSEAVIMVETNPRRIKAAGRGVKGFDQRMWDDAAREIVTQGNIAKFSQNAYLIVKLLETSGTLVEASPFDTIWGIGLAADDQRAKSRSTWRGLNLLGEILTGIRNRFQDGTLRFFGQV